MSTLRQHLVELHESQAKHHERVARLHKAMMESEENNSPRYELHKSLAQEHADEAERHERRHKILGDALKADEADDLRKGMVPSAVMGINPLPAGVRPVARAGSPDTFGKVAAGCESFVQLD